MIAPNNRIIVHPKTVRSNVLISEGKWQLIHQRGSGPPTAGRRRSFMAVSPENTATNPKLVLPADVSVVRGQTAVSIWDFADTNCIVLYTTSPHPYHQRLGIG